MRRRQFSCVLGSFVVSTPLPAAAQLNDKNTIGVLSATTEAASRSSIDALRKGLSEYGLIDGTSIRVVARYAENKPERLTELGQELVSAGSRIIVAAGTTTVSAAHQAAPNLPIVMAGSADPVLLGFAQSLARPGGRITGISILGEELPSKWLQILKEVVPSASGFAVFLQRSNPGNATFRKVVNNISERIGVRVEVMEIGEVGEFAPAFDRLVQQAIAGVVVYLDPVFDAYRETIFRLALEHRLPSAVGSISWARAGALVAYALDFDDIWRQSARYVNEILRGADPATLPIEQPTTVQVAVNMRTARALGLAIPPSILARADEVIE